MEVVSELKPKRNGNFHHNGNQKHGLYRENKNLFNLWQTMKSRCENKNREKYKDYGARGITVCEEWHTASVFVKWALDNGYKAGLQLDRIDNNAGYSPQNCRWVTPKENSRNRRNAKMLTLNGETKCVAEWCETIGVSQFTVYWWIREKGVKYAEQRLSEIA